MLGLLGGCSGISMINQRDTSDLYSKEFLKTVDEVKNLYSLGRADDALNLLTSVNDAQLSPTELALRNNLMGVVHFAKNNYTDAIAYFDKGLETSALDEALTAQINLNLGSAYYKREDFIRAYSVLKVADSSRLNEEEKAKYFRLFYVLAQEVGDGLDALKSLTHYLGSFESLVKIRNSHYFESLSHSFSRLGKNEKIRFLENFIEGQNLAAAYLGFLEAENLLYSGEKEFSLSLVDWLKNNFSQRKEILSLIDDFQGRLEGISRINVNNIGVILPFTGKRSEFANRSILGIDFAIRKLQEKFSNVKIFTVDSQGKGVVGATKVRELIDKHSVSMIIGGLFSDEAKDEYLEARKHGVMFISLSQIYLPRKDKGFLLVELPGSVESQVARAFSPDILNEFGKNVAVIYPQSDRGDAFINEIWSKSLSGDISVTAIQGYQKGLNDYRDPVAKILGLKYLRQRQEEKDFMQDVHKLQGKSSIRRVQDLPPDISFDWVYVPAYPQDAIQILPSFTYYDAFKVKFLGGPSWRSNLLYRTASSSDRDVYFIGDGINEIDKTFLNEFVEKYKNRPRLIELIGYEAINIAQSFLASEVKSREEFNRNIKAIATIPGLTGSFSLLDSLWIKQMKPFRVQSKRVEEVSFGSETPEET